MMVHVIRALKTIAILLIGAVSARQGKDDFKMLNQDLAALNGRWVHFMGDSTSRMLFLGFLQNLNPNIERQQVKQILIKADLPTTNNTAIEVAKERYDSLLLYRHETDGFSVLVTYLFRGKMMHQRDPREGYVEEDDVHNEFLRCFKKIGYPDAFIMSVAAHEVLPWTYRPRFTHDLAAFLKDANEFVEFSAQVFSNAPEDSLRIWWVPYELQPGERCGEAGTDKFRHNRRYHDAVSMAGTYILQEAGWSIVDFRESGKRAKADNCVHFPSLVWENGADIQAKLTSEWTPMRHGSHSHRSNTMHKLDIICKHLFSDQLNFHAANRP